MAVADTANNRILWWANLQEGDGQLGWGPDRFAAGRGPRPAEFRRDGENHWSKVTDDSLCWSNGLSLSGDRLTIADSGNNRIVV